MVEKETSFLKDLNWYTIGLILVIGIAGIANLYSLQINNNENLYITQTIWFIGGFAIFFVLTLIDYRVFFQLAYPLYIINILLLFIVLKFGITINASTRWINFGFFLYQPSESMKLILAVVLAKYFADNAEEAIGFKKLLTPFFLTLLPAVLIKMEPDLGSATILFMEFAVLTFMAKIKKYVWFIVITLSILAIPIILIFVMDEYHKKRVDAFFNPEKYAKTTAYQTIQSKFAIGSGQMDGKGFTKGPISKGGFVPEQKTDFAFSVWAEEFGFKGSVTLLLIYFLLIYSLFYSIQFSTDHFGLFLSVAIITYLIFQVLLNFFMVTGMFPVIGVPLPLFSYGGTNMLITMGSMGIIMSLYSRKNFFSPFQY